MMRHLILTNILIIVLEIPLLTIQYLGMFYLGGSFKPLVYGVKLRIEFSILNRLVSMTRARGSAFGGLRSSETGGESKSRSDGSWVDRALARGDGASVTQEEEISRTRTNDAPTLDERDCLQETKSTTGITLEYKR